MYLERVILWKRCACFEHDLKDPRYSPNRSLAPTSSPSPQNCHQETYPRIVAGRKTLPLLLGCCADRDWQQMQKPGPKRGATHNSSACLSIGSQHHLKTAPFAAIRPHRASSCLEKKVIVVMMIVYIKKCNINF